jgi:hypothetical protein
MTSTWKDTVATALAAGVVIAYVGHLAWGGLAFVTDVRGMAAVGLVLGVASRRIGGRRVFKHEWWAMLANFGSLALGIAALATESEEVLALFVASIVGLWAAATYVRAGGFHVHRPAVEVRGLSTTRRPAGSRELR